MKKFAQINFTLKNALITDQITHWKDMLVEAILDAGFIDEDEIRVLYSSESNTFSVSIPMANEEMHLIHIGALLGYVSAEVAHSSKKYSTQWISINYEDGSEVYPTE